MFIKKLVVLVIVIFGFFIGCDNGGSNNLYPFYLTEVSTSGSIGGLSIDYIELYNSTDEPIDLMGYHLGDNEVVEGCHEITASLSINEWNATTMTESVTTGAWQVGTTTDLNTAIIPAEGYLIILFTNDLAVDDAVSNTILPASWNEFDEDENDAGTVIVTISDTNTVKEEFVGETYLTVPAGLKGSKSEGVYIYKPDGITLATSVFTYEENEQDPNDEDYVFLSDGSSWSQGEPSPGAAN